MNKLLRYKLRVRIAKKDAVDRLSDIISGYLTNGSDSAFTESLRSHFSGFSFVRNDEDLAEIKKLVTDAWATKKEVTEDQMRSFSNTAAMKATNMMYLKDYSDRGTQKVKVVAVIDSHTTEICRQMNGRIIEVGAALQDVQDQKDIVMSADFWTANNHYVGQSKIPAKVPPYHYGCRSRVIPYVEPADPRKKLRDRLENYDLTESDLPGILSLAQQSSWKPGKLATHYKKHADELSDKSIESYNRRVYELIRDAGRNVAIATSIRSNKPYMALYVWRAINNTDRAEFVVVDMDNGDIITAYSKPELDIENEIKNNSVKYIEFNGGATVMKESKPIPKYDYIKHYSWLPEFMEDWDTWKMDIPLSVYDRQRMDIASLSPADLEIVKKVDSYVLAATVPDWDPLLIKFQEWLIDNKVE